MSERKLKILLLRLDRIGDLLVSAPFIANLRKLHPKAEIDILLSEKNIFALHIIAKQVDNIFVYKKNLLAIVKLIATLRLKKYDYIIDLLYNYSRTSNQIIRLAKPKESIGLAHEQLPYGINITKHHHRDMTQVRIMNQLITAFDGGLELLDKVQLEIAIPTEVEEEIKSLFPKDKKHIGINFSGSNEAKTLKPEKVQELIENLEEAQANLAIHLYTTKKTEAEARQFETKENVTLHKEMPTIQHLAASINKLDLYITPDTATVQLAAIKEIPTIVLYAFEEKHPTELMFRPENPNYIPLHTRDGNINSIPTNEIMKLVNGFGL